MGRVPASFMRAESVFYWIRQEKRKRRDAIAHLEAKSLHFYTKATSKMQSRYEAIAKLDTQMNEKEDVELPPLPVIDIKKDVHEHVTDKNDDDELMHWYNNENNTNEDNFHSEGMRGSEGGKTSTSIAPGGEVGRHLIMAPILQKMAISTSLLNSIFTWSKCSIRI